MNTEWLRNFCLSLPKVTEDIKWGNDLCFLIAEKMFCVTGTSAAMSASFKCDEEDFAALCERDGIIPAPYLAKNKWVYIQKATALTKKEWEYYIQKSYKLVASKLPKKLQKELGLI
jgi:predicted DNA-binding protein (MmcQ/YjbR family)